MLVLLWHVKLELDENVQYVIVCFLSWDREFVCSLCRVLSARVSLFQLRFPGFGGHFLNSVGFD